MNTEKVGRKIVRARGSGELDVRLFLLEVSEAIPRMSHINDCLNMSSTRTIPIDRATSTCRKVHENSAIQQEL